MIIKNVLPRHFEVLLNGKKYSFPAGASVEVDDKEGPFIMMLQPLLVCPKEETVKIEGKPEEIKAKKNVTKNKKSRK